MFLLQLHRCHVPRLIGAGALRVLLLSHAHPHPQRHNLARLGVHHAPSPLHGAVEAQERAGRALVVGIDHWARFRAPAEHL